MSRPIYLDYNATTPVDEEVLAAFYPYFSDKFGNAASITHAYGWEAKRAVDRAREQVAEGLNSEAQQLVFTSGSTEAINLAILGVWELYSPKKGKHIVTCQTEHSAVLDCCAYLEKFHGAEVTYLGVDEQGLIDLEELDRAISDETILVSIMHSNNETGVIQDVKKIAELVHEKNSLFMSDCTQSIGKIACNMEALGIDLCCISAHKFYGPKGVGALYYRRKNPRVSLMPQIHGGGHQRGLRSGTLNVPGIVGLGAAIQLAYKEYDNYSQQVAKLRDYLEEELKKMTSIRIVGEASPRLPNTANIIFNELDATRLIELTNGAIAVSTGSACTSEKLEPSYVLNAMFGPSSNLSSIRFSLGKYTTFQDIEKTIQIIKDRI